MPNVRPIGRKYNINKHRFMELYHCCLQYNDWKEFLTVNQDTMKSPMITEMPIPISGKSDKTCVLAIKRAELERKCQIIEDAARAADEQLYEYIIKAVTNEGITYNYLQSVMKIPCSHNTWYKVRRKFYWTLDRIMEGKDTNE